MISKNKKERKWLKPMFEFDESEPSKKTTSQCKNSETESQSKITDPNPCEKHDKIVIVNQNNWMKHFDPVNVDDLAVHIKKVQDVDEWLKSVSGDNNSDMLLLTGPVGCGKTSTIRTLAKKQNFKVTEWITPIDIDIPSEHGDFEYRVKQSTKFLDFILNAANFTSLLDNNNKKLVLVEDFPYTFMRTPTEFTEVLQQYKQRGKSPIVFICSESHTDSKNTGVNLFTPTIKDAFKMHHVAFNSISTTSLRAALRRVADIMSKNHKTVYNPPSGDMIECVVNSSAGDVRSAVLNLHFASLKGSIHSLETSTIVDKESKSKTNKRKRKPGSSKFLSIGKDQTVSILHGVGRVLNPKYIVSENGSRNLSHAPAQIIEQFLSQPNSFVNFLEENYLPHFSCPEHSDKAASALSDADYMLAEWREKMCQEYGLYTAVAGLMLANKAPVSAWNPVRGPKNMKIQYPSPKEFPLLEQDYLYKGKVLVADYQTYCKIIGSTTESNCSKNELLNLVACL